MKYSILFVKLFKNDGYAQEKLSFQFAQDLKFDLLRDKNQVTNEGTVDVTTSIMMQGGQGNCRYLTVFTAFEYTYLSIYTYKRWTSNVWYNINRLNMKICTLISYGIIDRGATNICWVANTFVKYCLGNVFKIVFNLQLSKIPDLDLLSYNNGAWSLKGHISNRNTYFLNKKISVSIH